MDHPQSGEPTKVGPEVIYNDPHAVNLLLFKLKKFLNLEYGDPFHYEHIKILVEKLGDRYSEDSIRGPLTKRPKGSKMLRCYFARPHTLTVFTELLGLGTWDEFRATVDSVAKGFPKVPPVGKRGPVAHKFYEELYGQYQDMIDLAIGVKPPERVGQEDFRRLHKPPFFVGKRRRVGLRQQAEYLIDPVKPLAILGMAGHGKTNFARNLLAHPSVVEAYGVNRFEVKCEVATTFELLLSAVQEALDAPRKQDEANDVFIFKYLSGIKSRKLVLFDNFDTCIEHYPSRARKFIGEVENYAAILCTLRSNSDPQIMDFESYILPRIEENEAIKIFDYRSKNKFKSDDDRKYLHQFVRDVDCLPLAVVLIASRASAIKRLSDLYVEWQNNKIGVLQLEGIDNDKEYDLFFSISFSYKSPRLKESDRALLKALCDFPAAVMEGRILIEKLAKGGFYSVDRLINVGLIEESEEGALLIHPMIRDYMNKQECQPQPFSSLLAQNYFEEAARLNKQIVFPADAHQGENSIKFNLRHAISMHPDQKESLEALCDAAWFLRLGGEPLESLIRQLESGCETAATIGWEDLHARSLFKIGYLSTLLSTCAALKNFQDASTLYAKINHNAGQANCMVGLAFMATKSGDINLARSNFDAATSLYCASFPRLSIGDIVGEFYLSDRKHEYSIELDYCNSAIDKYSGDTQIVKHAQKIRRACEEATLLGEYKFALKRCENAIEFHRRAGLKDPEAVILMCWRAELGYFKARVRTIITGVAKILAIVRVTALAIAGNFLLSSLYHEIGEQKRRDAFLKKGEALMIGSLKDF